LEGGIISNLIPRIRGKNKINNFGRNWINFGTNFQGREGLKGGIIQPILRNLFLKEQTNKLFGLERKKDKAFWRVVG